MRKGKFPNGRWNPSHIKKVMQYAKKYSNIDAIKKFDVPPNTFYAWLRRYELE